MTCARLCIFNWFVWREPLTSHFMECKARGLNESNCGRSDTHRNAMTVKKKKICKSSVVVWLLDLMLQTHRPSKDCRRIHPIKSCPLSWYPHETPRKVAHLKEGRSLWLLEKNKNKTTHSDLVFTERLSDWKVGCRTSHLWRTTLAFKPSSLFSPLTPQIFNILVASPSNLLNGPTMTEKWISHSVCLLPWFQQVYIIRFCRWAAWKCYVAPSNRANRPWQSFALLFSTPLWFLSFWRRCNEIFMQMLISNSGFLS